MNRKSVLITIIAIWIILSAVSLYKASCICIKYKEAPTVTMGLGNYLKYLRDENCIFAEGLLTADKPIEYNDKEYICLKVVREEYRRHSHAHKHGVTSHYQWDFASEEIQKSEEVTICDTTLNTGNMNFNFERISPIECTGDTNRIRYVYYGVPNNINGALYAELGDGNTIEKSSFYSNKTIDDTRSMLIFKAYTKSFLFMFFLAILCGIIYVFIDLQLY